MPKIVFYPSNFCLSSQNYLPKKGLLPVRWHAPPEIGPDNELEFVVKEWKNLYDKNVLIHDCIVVLGDNIW